MLQLASGLNQGLTAPFIKLQDGRSNAPDYAIRINRFSDASSVVASFELRRTMPDSWPNDVRNVRVPSMQEASVSLSRNLPLVRFFFEMANSREFLGHDYSSSTAGGCVAA